LFLILFFSCKKVKTEKIFEENLKSNASQNELIIKNVIQEVKTLSFRRSYAGHENLSDQELEELYKSNPGLETYKNNSKIVEKLNQLNLLENHDLILSKFENKKIEKEYLDEDKNIEINCKYDSLNNSEINFIIKNKDKKNLETLDFNREKNIISVILKDIDDDKVKEILVLTNFYIMNGDNYLLTILKYK